MEADSDLVHMFSECTSALKHFQNQSDSTHRHALRYYTSTEAQKSHEVLRKICTCFKSLKGEPCTAFFPNSNTFEGVVEYLAKTSAERLDEIGPREWTLLEPVIRALSSTRTCLIASMTIGQLLDAARIQGRDGIEQILALSEQKHRTIEEQLVSQVELQQRNLVQTKDDLKLELVKKEYDRNRKLNKFEKWTDQKIKEVVEAELDCEWDLHCVRLQELPKTIKRMKAEFVDWKTKFEALHLFMRENYSTNIIDHGSEQTVIGATNTPQHIDPESTETPTTTSSTTVCKNEHGNVVDTSLGPNSHDEWDEEAVSELVITSTRSPPPTTPHARRPTNIKLPPKERPHESTTSVDQTATTKFTIYEDIREPNTPSTEDSFTFISKRAYEYDFNKENTPVVAFPGTNKDSLKKAFVGLDQYARTLFSQSPSVNSLKPSRGSW